MSKTKPPKGRVVAKDPDQGEGKFKRCGGSTSDAFNDVLTAQVVSTLWLKHADEEGQTKLMMAALSAISGKGPYSPPGSAGRPGPGAATPQPECLGWDGGAWPVGGKIRTLLASALERLRRAAGLN